jgi:hypothetical protein
MQSKTYFSGTVHVWGNKVSVCTVQTYSCDTLQIKNKKVRTNKDNKNIGDKHWFLFRKGEIKNFRGLNEYEGGNRR